MKTKIPHSERLDRRRKQVRTLRYWIRFFVHHEIGKVRDVRFVISDEWPKGYYGSNVNRAFGPFVDPDILYVEVLFEANVPRYRMAVYAPLERSPQELWAEVREHLRNVTPPQK